ncbi:MAG: hypothetical protein AB7N73_15530 [Gemmatimonadales bacterium]
MSLRHVTPLLTALGLLLPAGAGAQDATQRAAIDSLFLRLTAVATVDAVPDESTCAPYRGALGHLCKGALATKRAELADDADAAITAERELRQVVEGEPSWAAGWYALGMARLTLARTGVTARPGPLQVLGMSWEAGAGHALVRSLELDSTDAAAATALALGGIPREGKAQLSGRLAMLRRVRPLLGPAAMLGAAKVERVAGSRDSAAVLFRRALQSGVVDSGFVSTELARELYASGHTEEGARVLLAGAATTSDQGRAAYRRELEWVAEPAELQAWDATAPTDRPGWLRQFWAGRDVREGWPDGTRLVEHYRRIETAWKDFTLALPPSGRHQLASRTGGVDTFVDELLARALTSAEGLETTATDDTDLVLAQMRSIGLNGPFRAFRTAQEVLDDRGIVWIRYGEPDKLVTSVGGEQMQVWAYERIQPRLVLQFREENFDGQAGASVLVPTLIDVPGRFRDQFCGVEQSLCAINTEDPANRYQGYNRRQARQVLTDGGRVTAAVVSRTVAEGQAQIERATTTDANPRVFEKSVQPIVQLYGLMVPGAGRSVALAAFALPADQLEWTQPPAAGGRTVYSVRMLLSLLGPDGRRLDVDTLRHFAVPRPLDKGQYLSGTLEVPLAPGRYQGSLLLTQADGRGAVATLPGIGVPSPTGRLALSSIVLGRESSGALWRTPSGGVPLNPLGAFTEKGEAELYYQVVGMAPGTRYTTVLDFVELSTPDEVALSLTFEDTPGQPTAEVQRTVGLANLKPGRYRLRVTLTGGGMSAAETAILTVVKR